jgi:ribosomal protein L22
MTEPEDPKKGKAAEEEQTEAQAAEAKAEASEPAAEAAPEEAKPKRTRTRAKKAEATAAAETGAGEAEAEAAVAEEPVAEEPVAEEPVAQEPVAEEAAAAEPVAEEAVADAATAAEEAPKRRRSRARKPAEPVKEEPKPARPARRPADGVPVVRAQAKYVRTSARKARLVCDHIRGKSVVEARAILAHAPRAVARDWAKLLESAVANAEHNHELVGDELRILTVTADEGPTLKRFRPRAMGRATRIRKRTSHLTIALTPKE